MTRRRAGAVEALAVACLLVAFFNRRRFERGMEIEGAYFNRSEEGDLSAPALAENPGTVFDPFDALDPYLWLGMGAALAVAGVAMLAVSFGGRSGRGT